MDATDTDERRSNVSCEEVYDPGFGFLKGVQVISNKLMTGMECKGSAEDQIGAKDVMNVCQHRRFSVNYA